MGIVHVSFSLRVDAASGLLERGQLRTPREMIERHLCIVQICSFFLKRPKEALISFLT